MDAGKKRRSHLWMLPVLVAAVSALIGVAIGKYIKTEQYSGTLEFNAELASNFQLLEHEAVRLPDGSYELGSGTVTKNEYTLIPGLDVPKDPHVIITDKTSIAAYLFVEVVDSTNGSIEFRMSDDNWMLLDGVAGKQEGGAVYVYAKDGSPASLTRTVGDMTIYLLENNKITVGQKLLGDTNPTGVKFYAAMGEVNAATGGTPLENAKTIYQSLMTKK